jgi:hypothetical protein
MFTFFFLLEDIVLAQRIVTIQITWVKDLVY